MNSFFIHRLFLTVYVLLLLVTKFVVSVDVQCIERERLALLELKQGFLDSYDRLSSWGDGDHQKECCNWTGVRCSHDNTNHVVVLDLRAPYYEDGEIAVPLPLQPLGGIVAPSLSKLDYLTHLDLSGNNFNGTEIPQWIGSFVHLRYLNLSSSSFGGRIPHQLGNLENLQYLDLQYNDLVGGIPNSLGNLSSLEYLYFAMPSGNFKSNLEWLPTLKSLHVLSLRNVDLGAASVWTKMVTRNLTHLKELILSDCNLVGNFPEKLGAFSQLEYLDLSHNSLTGMIPHQLGYLSQLQELNLGRNQLSGIIPDSLWDLCHLSSLELGSNNFSAGLDDFLNFTMGRTPRCSHESLQHLDLSSNRFTGSIPDLSYFLELHLLDLSNNKLNGTLSDDIGQLSNLRELDISSNPLQGMITEDHLCKLYSLVRLSMHSTSLSFNISKSWFPPFQLEILKLGYSKIGPYFPEWLKNQKSIQVFSLHHNEIVHVPDWFWRGLRKLKVLNLSHNKIQGEIANMPVQFSNSLYIDLSSNQLRGEIPPSFFQAVTLHLSSNMFSGSIFPLCSLTHSSLQFLDISHNQFSEELPADCWFRFKELIYLDLSFNTFSGEVPASLLSLPSLQSLHLGNNKFQSIPLLSSSNLTSLRVLDLSENEISSLLPSWIGDELVNLNVLSLRNNKFYGSLPLNICNLTQILVFDLSANNFSGSIPKCFNRFFAYSNISNLDVGLTIYYETNSISNYTIGYFNDSIVMTWKGGLAEYKSMLRLQRVIDLSDNQLTGEIPDEIMDLHQLLSLNLSSNKLSGKINQKIGQLINLESLDLSRNLLYGPIPPSIAQLNFLAQLNLSFNNLSGNIPTGFQLQTLNDASIYAENLELCGPPLDKICPIENIDNGKSDIMDQGEDGNAVLFNNYEFYISTAIGFIMGFWTSCGCLILCK